MKAPSHVGTCTCDPCSAKRHREDAAVEKVEKALKALYLARRGRFIVACWYWCAECGAEKGPVDNVGERPLCSRCREEKRLADARADRDRDALIKAELSA